MQFKLEKAILRPWETGDVNSIVKYANNKKVWRNLRDAFPFPYTIEHGKHWINIAINDKENYHFTIAINNEASGAITISRKQDVYKLSAEIGYWLGEPFWGQGIVTEAVQKLSDYVLMHSDIKRISTGIYEWNAPSMRVLEKAGFFKEARLQKSIFKDGQLVDEVIYSRLYPNIVEGRNA